MSDQKNYERLAAALIGMAAQEYWDATRPEMYHYNRREQEYRIQQLENYFRSDFVNTFFHGNVDPEKLMKMIRERKNAPENPFFRGS